VWRGGTKVHLGSFATAEEAALCIAQLPDRGRQLRRSRLQQRRLRLRRR
jgi:hypothetical protein